MGAPYSKEGFQFLISLLPAEPHFKWCKGCGEKYLVPINMWTVCLVRHPANVDGIWPGIVQEGMTAQSLPHLFRPSRLHA